MLGKGGLAQPDECGQFGDRYLPLGQDEKDVQPLSVAHGGKKVSAFLDVEGGHETNLSCNITLLE